MAVYIFHPDKTVTTAHRATFAHQYLVDVYTYYPEYGGWDYIVGDQWRIVPTEQVPAWCRAYILLLDLP